MIAPPAGLRQGREDALTILTAGVVVLLTWWCLGWSWPALVSSGDGTSQGLVVLRELVAVSGDWDRLLYRPGLLGGIQPCEQFGPLPAFALLARLGLPPVAIWNLTCFFLQVLAAFLGVRTATDVAGVLGTRPRLGLTLRIAGTWLFGFAPVLGWRLAWGHVGFVSAPIPFLAAASLIAASAMGTVSAVLVVAAVIALASTLLSTTSMQVLLASALFGGPLLAALWTCGGARARSLLLLLWVGLASVLLAAPGFVPMVQHVLGPDSSRRLGGPSLLDTSPSPAGRDFLGSIPWMRNVSGAARADGLDHEFNYPLGPPLLLLALLASGRARARGRVLLGGLAAGFAAAMLFASHVWPVLQGLLAVLPVLSSFRLPGRSVLPFAVMVPVLAVAAALGTRADEAATDEPEAPLAGRQTLAAVVALVLLWMLPGVAREVAGWMLAALLLVRSRLPVRVRSFVSVSAVLLVLGGLSVAAFRERLLPFPNGVSVLERAAMLGRAVRAEAPEIHGDLERVTLSRGLSDLQVNTAFTAGLSSIDGYHLPTRRFLDLVFAVTGMARPPVVAFMSFRPGEPVLSTLYDVRWAVDPGADGSVRVTPLPVSAPGPAWFPERLESARSVEEIAGALRASAASDPREIGRTGWLLEGDPAVAAGGPTALPAACAAARVLDVKATGLPIRVRVQSPDRCLLVLSTNYVEPLVARIDASASETAVVPAYHALAAVWVPAGAHEVVLDTHPRTGRLAWLSVLAGVVLLFVAIRTSG